MNKKATQLLMPPFNNPHTPEHGANVIVGLVHHDGTATTTTTTTTAVAASAASSTSSSTSSGVKNGSNTPSSSTNNKNTTTSDQKVSSTKNNPNNKNAPSTSKKSISLKTKFAFKFGTFNKMPILSSVVKSNPILVKLNNPKTYNGIKIKTIRKDNKTVIVISKRKLFKP